MARRTSTRYRIVERAKQAENLCDRIFDQFQMIDELADGQSEYITQWLPMIVVALSEFKTALKRFNEGL